MVVWSPEITNFLTCSGLLRPGTAVDATPLTGGVASDIWRVESGGRTFVVKRALNRLRVAQEWVAPVSRNASEVEWLIEAGRAAPDAVPKVLAHDPELGAFAMSYLDPRDYPVWKNELRGGRVDPSFASALGRTLAIIHAAGAAPDVAARFANDTNFHAIRLEPYLEATARVHPDLAETLVDLSRTTLSTKRVLIHGDVSPKNILVGPAGPVLLDAECAWFGEPAFDLAFCLNHLLLKCLWRPSVPRALLACFDALAAAYLTRVSWEEAADVERRAARLLPGLLLARVDGKSPVEYLTAAGDKTMIRRFARSYIASPPTRLCDVSRAWAKEVGA